MRGLISYSEKQGYEKMLHVRQDFCEECIRLSDLYISSPKVLEAAPVAACATIIQTEYIRIYFYLTCTDTILLYHT